MFVAFVAAITAILVACIANDARKHLLVKENEQPAKVSAVQKVATKSIEKVEALEKSSDSGSSSLNVLLYIGCFLVIAAMVGFMSYVDQSLIPPVVIGVTMLVLIASLLLKMFVPILKSSAKAFNISALVMFVFWFAALSSLGVDDSAVPLVVFSIALLASLVSAAIFKSRGFWTLPFIILIGAIISLFGLIYDVASYELAPYIISFGLPITFMVLAVVCRYLWRSHSKIVPVPVRAAILASSYVYASIGAFIGMIVFTTESAPFATSITLLLLIALYVVDFLLAKKNYIMLRLSLQLLATVICFDTLTLARADSDFSTNALLITTLIAALIQGAVSLFAMLKKPTESCHRDERVILGFTIASLAILSMVCLSIRDNYYGRYGHYLDNPRGFIETIYIPDVSLAVLATLVASLVLAVIYSVLAIFIDRNALMLLPASLLVIVGFFDTRINSEILLGIMAGVMSLVAALAYFPIHKADKDKALQSSLISSISLAVISFFACTSAGTAFWMPVLVASAILLIFGYVLKKTNIVDWGYYVLAAAFSLCLVDISVNLISDEDAALVLELLATLAIPAAIILRDLVYTLNYKNTDKALSPNSARFVVGSVLAWIASSPIGLGMALEDGRGVLFGICTTIILLMQIAILTYSVYKKSSAMQIMSVIVIIFSVIAVLGFNFWIVLLLVGLALIGFAIFAIYRSATKAQNQAKAVEKPSETTNQLPPENKT